MNVVLIGAANLATNLAKELIKKKFNIIEIYSRSLKSAQELAAITNAKATNEIETISTNADLYIFSVKDSVLSDLIDKLPHNNAIWLHTAGSIPADVLKNKVDKYGVIYPLQTFSKNKSVDFNNIPIFVEGNNSDIESIIYSFAQKLSSKVYKLSSEKRKYIHLSAVFACNFTNHMYTIANNILEQEGIPFDVLLPLIDETALKVHSISPIDAQTGPAVRYDKNVIEKQLNLIEDTNTKEIYKLISKNIHKINNKK